MAQTIFTGAKLLLEGGGRRPLSDIGVLLEPQRRLKPVMKDGVIYKNELTS